MTNNLTLVPAGAGSGKTHRIEQELAGLVETGQVGASRILAVTFTESAAAELRGRIRGELMRRGRIEDALAIDRAYVGTIHALGQRLLTEHAFAAGRNPDARLVTEAERDLLIRREVGRSAALLPIISDLERFGYTRLHYELPLQITAPDGSQINGIIDCLAEGREGYAIIDHKSGPCPDPDARFATYFPQLRAYADAVEHCMPGKPVRLLAINWMNEGCVSSHRISEPESVT